MSSLTSTRRRFHRTLLAAGAALGPGSLSLGSDEAAAATAVDLNQDAKQALETLYKSSPVAEAVSKQAKAILVFPKILNKSKGWEFGIGPSLVVVNEGMAKNLTTSTLEDDAYAFISDQQGLMASFSIEGTKISKIKR